MPRSSINLSHNETLESGRKSPNKTLRQRRSLAILTRKCSPSIKTQARLTGGADDQMDEHINNNTDSIEDSELLVINPSENEGLSKSKMEVNARSGGPCCLCTSKTPFSTGNKKLDEMFDYVQQNLQEAGRSLASLSENFEHDFKLMLVEILNRIQQRTGLMENKLETCKTDVESLRKELMARLCDLDAKEQEITAKEEEIHKKEQEIAFLKEQLSKQSRGKLSSTVDKRPVYSKSSEKRLLDSAPNPDPTQVPETRFPEVSKTGISEGRLPGIEDRTSKQHLGSSDEKYTDPVSSHVSVDPDTRDASRTAEISRRTLDKSEIEHTDQLDSVQEIVGHRDPSTSQEKRRDIHSESSRPGVQYLDASVLAYPVGTTKNEAELTAEIMRLRQENDRIIKERTDYENAIQRALLRGVSSLNVETLKVLRSPPISCCAPCTPSSAPPSVPTEPIVSYKSPKVGSTSRKIRTSNNTKRSDSAKRSFEEHGTTFTKSPCTSPYCSVRRNRKCTSNSLLFLLHQTDPVSNCMKNENNNQTIPLGCNRSSGTKRVETVPCPRLKKQ